MISKFFIDRPIFASVISIVITLAGGIALFTLPIAQYPPIAPPTVQVDCRYPGASARDVAQAVASPIEQQVNGVEGMLYMSSQCTNDGAYNLTVTFRHGMNLNMAQVLVQNRVALALPLLPDVIKQAGVTARKRSPDILLAIAINSPDGSRDQLYLSNYALMHVKDELSRLPGISDVTLMGQQDYSMRIWVDPEKLASRNLSASDVVRAIREQNRPVATGQIGQPPVPGGQPIQMSITAQGRLVHPEDFDQIVVKVQPDGSAVRVKDVARVELGAKNQDMMTSVNGRPSVSMAIFQLPDANALDTAIIVKDKINEMVKDFPEGVGYEIRYDTTPFISESIGEVFKTLREAIILVAIVVLLFLQNWRSAVIPLIAVPVAIIGTFAVMAAMGFSINNLTLFGLVLAIGIVVDDAIVVVEAVEHHMEQGLSARQATIVAMEEVSGPVIAIGLVLTAVFVPCAFISGVVGQFFRQFALTIAASTVISTINSLTLSPALAALLLRPPGEGEKDGPLPRLGIAALGGFLAYEYLLGRIGPLARAVIHLPATQLWWGTLAAVVLVGLVIGWLIAPILNWSLRVFFKGFNRVFRWSTGAYTRGIGYLLRGSIAVLAVYGGLLYLTERGFATTAKGFIPSQDMGYILLNVQLPDAASLGRTKETMDKIERISHELKGVKHTQSMTGQSMLLSASGSNFGSMFIILDEFSKRQTPDLYGEAIMAKLRKEFEKKVPEAMITVLGPPPVRGVGRAGGFKLMVEDRGDFGLDVLQGQTDELAAAAKATKDPKSGGPMLVGMTSVFRANVPQLFVKVDRKECMIKQVKLKDLFDTLQIYLGSLYVNDFNQFGRTWQVIVQADSKFRNNVEDVKLLKVRNERGQMVPIGSLAQVTEVNGPLILPRYNMYTAAPVNGSAAPGVSSGKAIEQMEKLAKEKMLSSMQVEWTELAYLELQAGNTAMIVFGFAVVMVFLVLAAQYESWALPLAVILVVPLCLLSSIAGVKIAEQDINIFTQIGFVVLVGLACKNAILIVEFARAQRKSGMNRREATLEACRLRLRPIIMTSMAFILGVFPLLTSRGAGAEMRRTLGTTVFAGMLGVTFFGILLTPVFFFIIDWLSDTSFFRSRIVRRISTLILGLLSLRPLRRGVMWARVALSPKRPAKPAAVSLSDLEVDGRPEPAAVSSNGHAIEAERHAVATNGHTNGAHKPTNGYHHPSDTNGHSTNGNGHATNGNGHVPNPTDENVGRD